MRKNYVDIKLNNSPSELSFPQIYALIERIAGKKYAESGIANTMPQVQPPTQEELEKIRDILQKTVSAEILLP